MPLWPLTKETQLYILKCPNCSNKRQFQAVNAGEGQLLWVCPMCGYYQELILIPVPDPGLF